MLVYRICRRAFHALDGEGARQFGGRWNTPGTPLVYTSRSLSLAALEYLLHVDPDDVPSDLVALTIEVPDGAPTARVTLEQLPADWARGVDHPACQRVGDVWARRGAELALRVPAAPVVEEENLLLNPRHPDASSLRVVATRRFAFDPRLLR